MARWTVWVEAKRTEYESPAAALAALESASRAGRRAFLSVESEAPSELRCRLAQADRDGADRMAVERAEIVLAAYETGAASREQAERAVAAACESRGGAAA
jgi:hypothetical protein